MLVRVAGPHAEFGFCWAGRDYRRGDTLDVSAPYVVALQRQGWVEPIAEAPPGAGAVSTVDPVVDSRDVAPRRRRSA